jgi:hypothetical protein
MPKKAKHNCGEEKLKRSGSKGGGGGGSGDGSSSDGGGAGRDVDGRGSLLAPPVIRFTETSPLDVISSIESNMPPALHRNAQFASRKATRVPSPQQGLGGAPAVHDALAIKMMFP